jgi:hypothetical protein
MRLEQANDGIEASDDLVSRPSWPLFGGLKLVR